MIRLVITEENGKILSRIHGRKRIITYFNNSLSTSSGAESDLIVRICRELGLEYRVDIIRWVGAGMGNGNFMYVTPHLERSIIKAKTNFYKYSCITVFGDLDPLAKELREKYNYAILYNYGIYSSIIK